MARGARSPRYPAVSVSEAARRAVDLYRGTKATAVTQEIAARTLGYKGLSGPSRTLLSALRKYGFVAASDGRLTATTRTRVLAIKGMDSEEGRAELRRAVLEVPLFQALWTGRHGPDDQLVFDLVEHHGFNDDGAQRAVKAFRESLAHLEDSDESWESDPMDPPIEVPVASDPAPTSAPIAKATPQPTSDYRFKWPLGANRSVEVAFSAEPQERDIDALCAYLAIVRKQLELPINEQSGSCE